jgi:hypothetical protein
MLLDSVRFRHSDWQFFRNLAFSLFPSTRHVNDNVDLVLALPLAHLWVHLWGDRAGGARHSPGMARKLFGNMPLTASWGD